VDAATLPLQPGEALRSGTAAQVPLVIGTNRDELNLFMAAALRELDKPMSDERATEVLSRELPSRSAERIPSMLETYRGSRASRGLPSNNRALLGAIQTDFRFRMPSIAFAEAHGSRQPETFMYLFTYESPAMRGALRACHALEIPFVFGTLDAPLQDRFVGKGEAVEALSQTMMDSWLAFSRNGNPSTEGLGAWNAYEPGRRATMVFDRACALQDAPFEEERASWTGVFER
ncbi:MAG: carboxylesterase family protein, partial [Polyangiales bacterium]